MVWFKKKKREKDEECLDLGKMFTFVGCLLR